MSKSKSTAPSDSKVVKALNLIESGKETIRGAVRKTGANRSTVRHHLRQRGWSAADDNDASRAARAKPKKAAKKKAAKKKKKTAAKKPALQHHLITSADGQRSLTVFIPGQTPVIVAGDHPRFDAILAEAAAPKPDTDKLRELADVTVIVETQFAQLTDRLSARNGRLYFDGDELDTSLTKKILEMFQEENQDWEALANFLEKLYTNPLTSARDAFYGWLSSRPFAITHDGDVIGYKGVEDYEAPEDGESWDATYQSSTNGPAVVNGKPYDGESGEGVPQSIGDTVEKPRSSVDNSTRDECSDGLHVGTYDFASSGHYGGTVLKVIVNPRDVVGVPTAVGGSRKFRCCRYVIAGIATAPDSEAVSTRA